jgi:hypothetical protein
VATDTPSAFIRKLTRVCRAIAAVTSLLEHVAGLLRQLVHVVGWLVLLAGSVRLLLQPHLSPEYLIAPGAGALAVLQGLIRPQRRQDGGPLVVLPDGMPELGSEWPHDGDAMDPDSLSQLGGASGSVSEDPKLPLPDKG